MRCAQPAWASAAGVFAGGLPLGWARAGTLAPISAIHTVATRAIGQQTGAGAICSQTHRRYDFFVLKIRTERV